MAEIQDISKDNFDTNVLSAKDLTLVYYHAIWCKSCEKAEEVLQVGAQEVEGKMTIARVNTDNEPEIVTQQKILTIPYFQIFHKGKVVESLNGVPSKLELIGMMNNVISEHTPEEEAAQEASKEE